VGTAGTKLAISKALPTASKHQDDAMRYRAIADVFRMSEIVLDVITVACAIRLSYWLYHASHLGLHAEYPSHLLVSVSVFIGVFMSGLLNMAGVYNPGTSLLKVRESEVVLRSSFQALMSLILLGWALQIPYPRIWTILGIFMACAALLLQKQILHSVASRVHLGARAPRRALICGSGNTAKIIANALLHSPEIGYVPVSTVTMFEMGIADHGEMTDVDRHNEKILEHKPDLVIFTSPVRHIGAVLDSYREQGIGFAFTPDAVFGNDVRTDWLEIDGILLSMEGSEVSSVSYEFLKRLFDFFGAAVLLLLSAPLIAIIAVAIRLNSKGPVWFQQTRVGRNGKSFVMLKFRSMHTNACGSEKSPENGFDPRITSIGRVLRKTSLDELPQLINVLKGDMSLVGPRPEMPFIVNSYTPAQRVRLTVKPGITGLWQLSADRRFPIHENMHYDVYYLRERGMFLDLAILIHTLFFAVRGI
jgi:exopolysaccharide biosynthesis polyprenyl glycosylphosphotransferase